MRTPRFPPRATALLAACWALGALRLPAQSTAQRAALVRLRDSLAGVTDSLALRRLETSTIAVAKVDRDNALLHLRLGFIAFRLGELADSKTHYDDAAGEFEWASELHPEWPYPWYGLGLAELAQGEHSAIAIENLRQQLGVDYLSKAVRAFARATQADPSFAAAAVDLANAALTQHIHPRLQVALDALRLSAASAAGRLPAIQLARGRVEREVGEADSALAAFGAYLRVGGDSGVGLFELARSQFFANRAAAAESSYYAGARAARSDVALGMYRHDLSYVADSAELSAYDTVPSGGARAVWLRRFWHRRDVAEARAPGERLAEHNRRWLYAWRHFRLVSSHRHYDITEVYRSDQQEFDDRGIIYIRHGPPDRRAVYVGEGTAGFPRQVEPNESWLYRRDVANEIFHFVSRGDVQDFKLVESALDAMGFQSRFRQQQSGTLGPIAAKLWDSRATLDPMYTRPPNQMTISDERSDGHRAIRTGTNSDSYVHRYDQSLHPVMSDFVAGAGAPARDPAGGGEALHVVVAIPADRLAPVAGGIGVVYPLHFRLLVATAAESLVARLDTVRYFSAPHPLRGASFLSTQLRLPLPPGRYRYHLLIETPDQTAGQVVERDTLEVPRLDGRHFAVSDLVLGRRGAGLVWVPRERTTAEGSTGEAAVDTVLLNPLGRFPTDSVAELYYEIYGLAAGAVYHTEIRLERTGGRSLLGRLAGLFGGHRPPVALAFDSPAGGRVTRVHRGVSLRGVAPGDYALTVTVTDPATGVHLSRTRPVEVVSGR